MFKIVRFCAKQCYVLPIKDVIDFVLKTENLYALSTVNQHYIQKEKGQWEMSNFDA